ncbi:MAG: RNase adapter RapZ [Lachnospiraceae bacterium]|jgi:UPF0042 nucleotide-binding protein|nr:RNase adapter RapZ [Lachnospiraceae bacterium]MEE3461353.1 RNase adapter RapZ [Lachnospiraceae bacterium]
MNFVIVTGMSGAGKSSVLKMLEDMGFFCVDNIPVEMLPKFSSLVMEAKSIEKAAIGIDIRNLHGLSQLSDTLDELKEEGYRYQILYLDAEDSVLIKRYKETRRNHPLALQGRVDKAIAAERNEIGFIRKRADFVIDTSHMLVRDLKHEVDRIFLTKDESESFFITILSFGFKYGIPEDADLVFDVRFLPNPFYEEDLKPLTGNDRAVYDYVMNSPDAKKFDKMLFEMIEFLVPNYIKEGKNQLVIAIGCTGGKHRSVTITNSLAKHMKQLPYTIKVEHRDIER